MVVFETKASSSDSDRKRLRPRRRILNESEALSDRILHGDLSWKKYITSAPKAYKNAVLAFRNRIIRIIKRSARTYENRTEEEQESSLSESSLRNRLPDIRGYIPIPITYRSFTRRDDTRPFILDLGSKSETSNADLTVLNAPSTKIIEYFLDRINASLKTRFDELSLHHLFDISFYVNSFLVNLRGTLCYVDARDDARSKRLQRKHATSHFCTDGGVINAKKNANTDFKKLDALLAEKKDAILTGRPLEALEKSSQSMYYFADAYRSQGAFLHVLVQIQAGVRLPLTADEYLDSAYDNLGMLKSSWKKARTEGCVAPDSSAFSKYAYRITHALREMNNDVHVHVYVYVNVTRLQFLTMSIVALFDEMSIPDMSRKRLRCSIGRLSDKIFVENTQYYTFMSVYAKSSKPRKNDCFVPHRMYDADKKNAPPFEKFLQGVKARLDEVSRLCGV